ncbi:MAG: hypothetical protein JRF71_05485, partial [Deltaproteobacteria bacterium]|nr:hypothetical protein [Deltaproteobacteria bacterium]
MNTTDEIKKNNLLNVSAHLKSMAVDQPYKRAVVCPAGMDKDRRIGYAHLTFLQLDQESDCLAHGLAKA